MPVVPVRVARRGSVYSDRLHNPHSRPAELGIRICSWRGIIYEGAVIPRVIFEGITTEICTVNDILTSMCHYLTYFSLPILRPAAAMPASGSVCESLLALAQPVPDTGASI